MADQERIVYVRQEAPNLLGRSMVMGFGFGLGLTAAGLVTLILATAFFKALVESTFHLSL